MSSTITGKLFSWLVRACVLVLLLLLAFRVYGYFELQKAAGRFQREAGPLDTSAYAPAEIADIENAAVPLEGGAYAVVMTTEERGFLRGLTDKGYFPWDEATRVRARAIVQRNEAAYQVLALALPLEKSSFNLKYKMAFWMPIPNYLRILQSRLIVGARARLQLMNQETAEALQTMAVQERMAAALLHEPVIISCMTGESVQKDYDSLVQAMLPRSDVAMLKVLAKQLQHLRAMAGPRDRMFAADGAAAYSSLRERYPVEQDPQMSQSLLPRWLYCVNRRMFLADLLNYYSDTAVMSRIPLAKQPERPAPAGWSTRRIVEESLGLSNLYQAIGRVQTTNAELLLAQLAVKVILSAKEKGAYPADLSGFAAETCPYTGEPVQYKAEADGSATLSYPEADRFWDQNQKDSVARKPLLTWKLPALQPQAESGMK